MLSLEKEITLKPAPDAQPHLERRTGCGVAIGHTNMLQFGTYNKVGLSSVPDRFDALGRKKLNPVHDWYNKELGDCTIASQGVGQEYSERWECRTFHPIDREEIKRTYFALLQRVYNTTQDAGAYEMDALNNWRNPDYTFRNAKGNPLTIDAYTRVNQTNIQEVKAALVISPTHFIKTCFALPLAWYYDEGFVWDIPEGQQPTGNYQPYSWGGHSTAVLSRYTKDGVYVLSTWNTQPYFITWRAYATYATEAYSVIDSVDAWRKKVSNKDFNLKALISNVNSVSSVKIAA